MITIDGGTPLHGTVNVEGSKNTALPLLAATACVPGPLTLTGLPASSDVMTMLSLLTTIGFELNPDQRGVTVGAPAGGPPPWEALEAAGAIRASYYLVPGLLNAHGEARLPWPGGCAIGARGMELHFAVYRAFGDRVTEHDGGYTVSRHKTSPLPLRLELPIRSRGATIAAVLRAVVERRHLTLGNPNMAPETLEVLNALSSCQVDVKVSEEELTVHLGTPMETGSVWQVPGDKVEAFTLLCALAVTGGSGTVSGINPDHLTAGLSALRQLGFEPKAGECEVSLDARSPKPAAPLEAIADLAPGGLDADFEPALIVTALGREGTHRFGDDINPGRHNNLLPQLARFGAQVTALTSTMCELTGPQSLRPADADAPDIRSGTALVLAALAATGVSIIGGTDQIRRGHPDLVGALGTLGARIRERT
ncbi:hypothetical protein [Nocardiopsis sp. LDBS1602]|uniref:hypothetical protein n=1 Tax=Nocardiopsis sp. LDBS1602 TaxID=3109597 RepID=UPI002DB80929|nr:hypothetical protein [Nocardiopsis sp. LDBS1602]MEC3891828.1 hypothetical protein [Nocardiopsis sp. LDBS1602]